VQFDPSFQTVRSSFGGEPPLSLWQGVCGFGADKVGADKTRNTTSHEEHGPVSSSNFVSRSGTETANQARPSNTSESNSHFEPASPLETGIQDFDDWNDDESIHPPAHIDDEPVLAQEENEVEEEQTVRRSSRTRIPVVGNRFCDLANEVLLATSVQGNDLHEDPKPSAPAQGEVFCESALFPFEFLPFEDDPLQGYGASNDPDVFYFHEAMREPDAADF